MSRCLDSSTPIAQRHERFLQKAQRQVPSYMSATKSSNKLMTISNTVSILGDLRSLSPSRKNVGIGADPRASSRLSPARTNRERGECDVSVITESGKTFRPAACKTLIVDGHEHKFRAGGTSIKLLDINYIPILRNFSYYS